MTTPSDQMSVRWSTVFGLRTCSGDMYGGEPSTARPPVSCIARFFSPALS